MITSIMIVLILRGLYDSFPVPSNNQQNPLVGQTVPVFNYRARHMIPRSLKTVRSATKMIAKILMSIHHTGVVELRT